MAAEAKANPVHTLVAGDWIEIPSLQNQRAVIVATTLSLVQLRWSDPATKTTYFRECGRAQVVWLGITLSDPPPVQLFQLGDHVQVYATSLKMHTEKGIVVGVSMDPMLETGPRYSVRIDESMSMHYFSANQLKLVEAAAASSSSSSSFAISSEMERAPICVVCTANPRNAITACNHVCMCLQCARTILATKCPLCSTPFTLVNLRDYSLLQRNN